VTMGPENPATASAGIAAFRARLTDGGEPLAGRELTFDLEYLVSPVTGARWEPYRFRAHGITDADGWATGRFDIDDLVEWWGGPGDFRIAARFHGDAERRPAIGTAPFSTEDLSS